MYDNNSFFYKMKQTVYKWWCVIYRPVYKLTHHGYWPKEKEPYYQATDANATQNSDSQPQSIEEMANRIVNEKQSNIDDLVNHTSELVTPNVSAAQPSDVSQTEEIDTSNVDTDVMSRANEIMERLAKEAAEDEAKKQAERDKARREAEEQQRLAAILKSTKVDISPFIEEGKAMQHQHRE